MNKKKIAICMSLFVLLVFAVGLVFFFSTKETSKETDAIRFKSEYEALNNQETTNQKHYRTVSIKEDNPIIYATAKDIVNKVENKETFAVYFGFAKCPWCRSIIETLMQVASDLNLSRIYYVDIENIRDVKEIDEKGNIKTTKEGTKEYLELLDLFADKLEKYTLNNNGKEIDTKEKRIYAPSIISVVEGKVDTLTTGISKLQKDAYEELTDEMKNNSYEQIKCALECVKENQAVCTKKTAC